MELLEEQRLSAYAAISKRKIYSSQGDLDPKDHAEPAMLAWCRQQNNIVVLCNGAVLANDPAARAVQNCKIIMQEKKIPVGEVFPASQALIQILLENASLEIDSELDAKTVSIQQQRLRILVKEALDCGATDIHIEIRADNAKIRFRKQGELFLHAEWLPKLAKEVASVAFNKETDHSVSHFNPLIPQNASMPLEIDGREVRLRLATLPAHNGFDLVLRVLAVADESVPSLSTLGYAKDQIVMIERATRLPHGAVIVAGPTGSGKTTTLASCLQLIHQSRKLYTIEDPVEKVLHHATQVPVNTDYDDRDFASMARTVLRMDPDVVVLGEIRDEETAAVMIRAAITGHLIFSTLHTNSATEIVTRLHDLGSALSLLASPELLSCLICQRLYPVLCVHCAIPFVHTQFFQQQAAYWRSVFGGHASDIQLRGAGCEHCQQLGIQGRSVVAEMLWIRDEDREFIQAGRMHQWRAQLKQQGWRTMKDRLLTQVLLGRCDPFAAEKIVGPIYPMPDQNNNLDNWGEVLQYATQI